jgi:hypothetical protein
MPKKAVPEKGKMDINGHVMEWEIFRSQNPSVFGINQSRIYELNIYRDGALTVDFNKKWIKVPYVEDEESSLCMQYLLDTYGKKVIRIKKGEKNDA